MDKRDIRFTKPNFQYSCITYWDSDVTPGTWDGGLPYQIRIYEANGKSTVTMMDVVPEDIISTQVYAASLG
jgi:hypothetical protein